MKICIVRPSVLHKEVAFSHMPVAPLGPAYIAAVLREEGHEIQALDAAIEGYDQVEKFKFGTYIFGLNKENTIKQIDEGTEIICFSFMFTNNWYFDRELVDEARKKFPDSVIIAGGEHVTAVPEYCFDTAPELDYIVMGEGEATIVELIHCIENNKPVDEISRIAFKKNTSVQVNNTSRKIKRVQQINDIPWPAWDLFPLQKYFENKITYGVYRGNSLPIMASRGCPYECTFCSNPQMWGRKYSLRSVMDFVDEMEFLNSKYNVVNFDFYDLTAVIKKYWIIEMCDEIMRRNLKICYQMPAGTRTEAIDFEVAEKLYKSGCKNITYAPESGSDIVLSDIKKKVKLEHLLESIRFSKDVGMNIKLNIMVGFPDETHIDILKTISFLVKSSWYGANDMYPAVFSPYPGSALYDRLVSDGEIDLYSDEYIMEIINSHDLWPGKVYNNKISSNTIKFYTVIMYLAFYSSNFLFRPQRFYNLIKNLVTSKHESRSELVISQTLQKLKMSKSKSVVKENKRLAS
ncbi:MAG: cobalamin-dependent protein [Chitinophagales bacterium]